MLKNITKLVEEMIMKEMGEEMTMKMREKTIVIVTKRMKNIQEATMVKEIRKMEEDTSNEDDDEECEEDTSSEDYDEEWEEDTSSEDGRAGDEFEEVLEFLELSFPVVARVKEEEERLTNAEEYYDVGGGDDNERDGGGNDDEDVEKDDSDGDEENEEYSRGDDGEGHWEDEFEEVLEFLELSFPDVARVKEEEERLTNAKEYYKVGGGDDNEGDGGGNDDEDGGEDDSDGDEEDEEYSGGDDGEGDWEDGEDDKDEEEDEDEEEDDKDEKREGPHDGERDYAKDSVNDPIDEHVHIVGILKEYEFRDNQSSQDALFNEFLIHRNIDCEECLQWLRGRGDEKSTWWRKFLWRRDDDYERF
ncbi:protein bfr2-like [Magnolia sinica]|uniref:protein bfr2-like n=1 Tax=Magnolia sinica TaxID=86752 RepID=UPI0026586C84|nr:protein bfr2-like [Magnolia sinica]